MNQMIESPLCPRIAIIGTEGSGKTVLITMLAKRFSQANESSLFLNPLDATTLRFVERNYHILASGDWPPSSPVGQLFNLHWRLEKGGSPEWFCEIRLADSAGQDLRRVFGDDQPLESLPDQLKVLAEYSRQADIVICLVNLKDFRGEPDDMRRTDNEAVIKSALDYLISDATRQRHLCLLFTQADLFRQFAEKCGGWGNVAKKFLPYIHGAHVLNGRVSVAAVAAVADTAVREIDGRPSRVPAHGFRSEGLDSVMQWVSGKAHDVFANRLAEVQRIEAIQQDQERQRVREAEELGSQRIKQKTKKRLIWAGLIFAAFMAFLLTRPLKTRKFPLDVHGHLFSKIQATAGIDYKPIWDDVWIRNDSDVAVKNVHLKVTITNGSGVPQVISISAPSLSAHETYTWRNAVSARVNDQVQGDLAYDNS